MYKQFSKGMIEIITGPMFSGKSDELLKRIKKIKYVGIPILIIKPSFDSRFSDEEIVSRTGAKMEAHSFKDTKEIKQYLENNKNKYKAIAIDEVHFFDKDIVNLVDELANEGFLIILSGLDQDYLRRPFGVMPKLLSIAENIDKLQAICLKCKNIATCTYRKNNSEKLKLLGDVDEYEARCRQCHIKGEKEKQVGFE